ncbi:SpaA isopeptide-forming pilin-related protein [Chakrabartyella piscis]|uniref:SpaA isopeptide-forming pilin-related protein n=1 Tax=Chakrabartyella piscis TaxID=2918914 RepID=UPI002958921C|nr:SpaA isopeptide-forming pilin-related protein [Chakrabartyella piscis]
MALDDGSNSFDVQTDNSGVAYLSNMKSGTYTVTELVAPDGYLLDDTPQIIKLVAGEIATLTMQNQAEPGLLVRKVDEDTGMPLANAVFNIAKKGETTIHEMTTDKSGEIRLEGLEEGWYTITETAPPKGYLLETESKDIYLEPNKLVEVMFTNRLRPSLQIMKIDAVTNEPLAGATFKVTKTEDMTVSEYVTDSTGTIVIRDLDEAVYTVEEISAPTGYILDTQHKDIALEWGKTKTLVFENTKNPTLIVTKINGLTNEPIAGTVFEIQYENPDGGIENLGTYKTDASGKIVIENVESGWYIVTETIPAQGFSLPSNPTTRIYLSEGENAYLTLDKTESDDSQSNSLTATDTELTSSDTTPIITSGSDYTGGVTNYPLNSIVIKKVDANTSEMLAGAVFELRQVSEDISGNSGTIIGRYTTDNSGIVVVTGLTAGAYIVEEVDPPTNYLLSENSQQQAWLKADGTSIVEMTFTNYPYGSLLINKVDENDGTPLAGAVFKVTTGDGTLVGSSNGEYTTDQNGEILIPNLKPDSYVVTEIQAPSGYVINSTAKTIDIGTDGKTYELTFSNQPLSGLKIIKLDSETREPLADAEFEVRKLNGEYVGDYKTDYNGTFFVEDLEDGFYEVTEQKAPTGYHLDNEPKIVEVKSTQETVLEVLNEPYSDLVIEKIDSQTGEPIKGVEFLITKLNGEEIGYYTTDKYGLITVEGLASGDYILKETEAADGYKIEDTAIEFTMIDGQRTTVEVENTPMSSLFIRKIDSVTKEGIGGVKFLLYDADNDPIGEYESDNNGYVWLDKTLEDGKYKLREIEAAEGYIGDDEVKTFWVKEGKTTEIIWENTPQAGQIVITKRSSEYNELTGLPAGSSLSGAVFEIYNITGNLVDQITSDSDGVAASSLLPVGVYTIKEVSAPRYYALNDTMLLAEIRHNGDIIRFEVLNSSIDLDLSIQKKGPVQIMPSSTIHYEIYGVENGSSGSIEDFYIHDRIPTDATRILKITTGTFNERGYYTITYKTNYRDYMVLADNLLTENDYEFSLHSNVLGLQNGEYVTDVRFEFDSVGSGFAQTKNISVFCQVLPTMPSGYQIINRAEVGGRYGNEWESRTTSWNTTVFGLNPTYVTLPQTGY